MDHKTSCSIGVVPGLFADKGRSLLLKERREMNIDVNRFWVIVVYGLLSFETALLNKVT